MKLSWYLVALLLGVTACTPNGIDGRRQVALVGDSFTEGVINDHAIPPWLPIKEQVCYMDQCFAAIVEAYLEERDVDTARIGLGGATSRDYDPNDFHTVDVHFIVTGRELFSFVRAANVVVVLLGINDAVGFFEGNVPVPPEEYGQHLLDIAVTLRARGVERVILATAPTPAAWRSPHPAEERLNAYADVARWVASEVRGVDLIDIAKIYPADEWIEGAIHPTIEGHRQIAEAMIDKLEQVMDLDAKGPPQGERRGRGQLRRARPQPTRGPIFSIDDERPDVSAWAAELEEFISPVHGKAHGKPAD